MEYYRKYNPGGKWHKISKVAFDLMLNSHFEETPTITWKGREPSRREVMDHLAEGKELITYAANYKIIPSPIGA